MGALKIGGLSVEGHRLEFEIAFILKYQSTSNPPFKLRASNSFFHHVPLGVGHRGLGLPRSLEVWEVAVPWTGQRRQNNFAAHAKGCPYGAACSLPAPHF